MKRNHSHTVKSNRRCAKCGKRLKQNLIDRNPDAELCYNDWQLQVRRNPSYTIPKPVLNEIKRKRKRIAVIRTGAKASVIFSASQSNSK